MLACHVGYISRSVAGSFDNEGIAIFALILTYFCWVKAVKTGSLFWSAMCCLAYFYMVSAWGGYIFIINLIPLHVLTLLVTGRFSARLYVAYCTVYCLGTLLSMQVTFVGFQPVQSSEHMAALGVFGLLQLHCFINYLRSLLPPDSFRVIFRAAILAGAGLLTAAVVVGTYTGCTFPTFISVFVISVLTFPPLAHRHLALDRQVLLPSRSHLRQGPHSHHCFRI